LTVYCNLETWKPLESAIRDVNTIIEQMSLLPGYDRQMSGRARRLEETVEAFALAFLLSLVFMYMILASQFDSFVHPVTIMTSIPLSIPFALISLMLTQRTLNIRTALGILLLFGIVKKNGILQIDYTNTLRARGMERDKAIIDANHARLQPILMTTISIIAGLIPAALSKGRPELRNRHRRDRWANHVPLDHVAAYTRRVLHIRRYGAGVRFSEIRNGSVNTEASPADHHLELVTFSMMSVMRSE
jgi:multidrug efflux pump subunit AcrB